MGQVFTLLFIVIAGAYILGKLRGLGHQEDVRKGLGKAPATRTKERAAMEQEILERLERLKNPDAADLARGAVQRDPKRAAKVVSNMMKDKPGKAKR